MPWPRCSSHLELLAFKKGFNLFLKERVSPSGPPIPFERVHFRRPIFQETNNKGGGGRDPVAFMPCIRASRKHLVGHDPWNLSRHFSAMYLLLMYLYGFCGFINRQGKKYS